MLHNVPVLPTTFKNRFILGYPDRRIRTAMSQPAYPLFFELICHGSLPDKKGETFAVPYVEEAGSRIKPLNAEQLYEIIVTHPAYILGQPVRLIMCYAGYGPNSLAQQLADLLGAHVLAADNLVCAYTLTPLNNGRWIMFKPRLQ
ncbi:MAG: hypothetical protein NZ699_09230 [Roseiflexus sp.]|nr:hypothetical protein [Roseiflexus sp.]MCS7289298.1 hypothetical protein [Roseiflexus sp.]MDW8145022.1 hypothetical protein [Roseiflexaceae bacterium]MDW8231872.1 hypothetical protein [Roseiflexaceae bacterium]